MTRNVYTQIERSQLSDGASLNILVTEASDLGWRAGYWPTFIDVVGGACIGNGNVFVAVRTEKDAEGDVLAVHYRQDRGLVTLVVFND